MKLLTLAKLSVAKFCHILSSQLGPARWNSLKPGAIHPRKLELIQGISVEGNADSGVGKVFMYATHDFYRRGRPRYDFVLVQIEDGHQPAQLCALLKLTKRNNEQSKYFALVRYMHEVHDRKKPSAAMHCPFQVLQWEMEASGVIAGGRPVFSPLVCCVEMTTIVGPAFITQRYSTLPLNETRLSFQRFWMIDRKFCDRAGWENVNINDGNHDDVVDDNIDINIPIGGDLFEVQDVSDNEDENIEVNAATGAA